MPVVLLFKINGFKPGERSHPGFIENELFAIQV